MRYNENLLEVQQERGIGYLRSRGFSDRFLNRHMVGFAPQCPERDWLFDKLVRGNKVTPKDFVACNLGTISKETRLINDYMGSQRIVFPVFVDGNVVGFSSRTILPNVNPRYKTLIYDELPLYNTEAIKYADGRVYIAEGAIDTLSLSYMGFAAVGILGLSAFGKENVGCFEGFKGDVVIITDTDENQSGQSARQKIANVLFSAGVAKVSYKEIPKAQDVKSADVNSFMCAHGPHVAKIKIAELPEHTCEYKPEHRKQYDQKGLGVRFSIVDVVSQYTDVEQEGPDRFRCKCPLHPDSDPSCVLYTDTNMFKCFGCGEGGTAIKFLMVKEDLSYEEAIRRAASIAS